MAKPKRRTKGSVFPPYVYMYCLSYWVALLAPIVNSVQLLPQLVKTGITRHVNDLSFSSLLLILFTNLLWFLHGYFIKDISLIAAGFISLTINIMLFILYLRYK